MLFKIEQMNLDITLNEIWVDKGSEFYNKSTKCQLEKHSIEIFSTHNKRKSVVAKRFVRTLKTKIYKSMS